MLADALHYHKWHEAVRVIRDSEAKDLDTDDKCIARAKKLLEGEFMKELRFWAYTDPSTQQLGYEPPDLPNTAWRLRWGWDEKQRTAVMRVDDKAYTTFGVPHLAVTELKRPTLDASGVLMYMAVPGTSGVVEYMWNGGTAIAVRLTPLSEQAYLQRFFEEVQEIRNINTRLDEENRLQKAALDAVRGRVATGGAAGMGSEGSSKAGAAAEPTAAKTGGAVADTKTTA
jgi:hypothetical protein